MAYGRVVFILGAQTSLDPIIHFCEGVKRGRIQYQEGSAPQSRGRLSDAEILGVLTQLFQFETFLKREEVEVKFSFLGSRQRQDLSYLGRVFGVEIDKSDVLQADDLFSCDCDALIYVPLDTNQPKQVEHLARLSMVMPRVKHVALTSSPKWNHSQLMALKETWTWLDPRQVGKLQAFAEDIIRINGGLTRSDIDKIDLPKEKEASQEPTIITRSPVLKDMLALVDAIADTDSTVLITGESGVGKELVASRIHARSHRSKNEIVAVNCGAIPAELLESELFGHVKGAFTGAISNRTGRFESAHDGTLFLDEIGEMGPSLQVKLLRVLQARKYEPVGSAQSKDSNARIIAATNRDLEEEVREGQFREDLFYRLNVIPIHVPSLRERPEDIPLLVDFFVKKFNREKSRQVTGLTRAALRALVAYSWPGNVRELENLMERAVILKCSGMVDVLDFPEKYRRVSLSEIEYDDLVNPKKTFMPEQNSNDAKQANNINQEISSKSSQGEQNGGSTEMEKNYNYNIGQNIGGQSANSGTSGGISNGINEQQHQAQQNESMNNQNPQEATYEQTLNYEQALRLIADKMIFPEEGLDFNSVVDQFENILILQALERTGWNRNRAAGLLRLNRTTLVEKLKKKQLVPPMRFDNRAPLSGNA